MTRRYRSRVGPKGQDVIAEPLKEKEIREGCHVGAALHREKGSDLPRLGEWPQRAQKDGEGDREDMATFHLEMAEKAGGLFKLVTQGGLGHKD